MATGGLYDVPFRAPGTLITALIYNADHQRHVDGRSCDEMQALGVSTSQMNLVDNPFPGGAESFAPSLAGELTRLRFEIAAIKSFLSGNTTVNWYDALNAVGPLTIGARVQRLSSQTITTGTNTKIDFTGGTPVFNNPTTIWTSGSNQTRFTAPFDGLYYAFAAVSWAATGSLLLNKTRRIQLGVNNTFSSNPTVSDNIHTTATSDVHTQTIDGFLDLVATDFVEYRVFQDNGTSLNLVGASENSIVGGLIFLGSHS